MGEDKNRTTFLNTRCDPQLFLGVKVEIKLFTHVEKFKVSGFSPNPLIARPLAYDLASEMKLLSKKFNDGTGALRNWCLSFMGK